MIEQAQVIYILGYGFDELNNGRIGLDKLTTELFARTVHFTNFGDSSRTRRRVKSLFFGNQYPAGTYHGDMASNDGRLVVTESTKDTYGSLALDFDH